MFTSFPGCVTDHVTHRRNDTRGGGAVDPSAEREEESTLTTAAQIVPQPARRTHSETRQLPINIPTYTYHSLPCPHSSCPSEEEFPIKPCPGKGRGGSPNQSLSVVGWEWVFFLTSPSWEASFPPDPSHLNEMG